MGINQCQIKIHQPVSQHQTLTASTVPIIFVPFVRKYVAILFRLNVANTGTVQHVSSLTLTDLLAILELTMIYYGVHFAVKRR